MTPLPRIRIRNARYSLLLLLVTNRMNQVIPTVWNGQNRLGSPGANPLRGFRVVQIGYTLPCRHARTREMSGVIDCFRKDSICTAEGAHVIGGMQGIVNPYRISERQHCGRAAIPIDRRVTLSGGTSKIQHQIDCVSDQGRLFGLYRVTAFQRDQVRRARHQSL